MFTAKQRKSIAEEVRRILNDGSIANEMHVKIRETIRKQNPPDDFRYNIDIDGDSFKLHVYSPTNWDWADIE